MRRLAVIALTASVPLAASAGDEGGQFYLNPQIGGLFPERKRGLDDELLWGAGIGMNLSQDCSAEVNYNAARLDYQHIAGHEYPYALSLDVLRVWSGRSGRHELTAATSSRVLPDGRLR